MATSATQGVYENFDFHEMRVAMEFRNSPVGWTWNLDTLKPLFYKPTDAANVTHGDSVPIVPALTVPGYPEKSVLIFREKSHNTLPGSYDMTYTQMPPLATFEVNNPAVALLEKWVREMVVLPTGLGRPERPSPEESIRLRGRILSVPADNDGGGPEFNRGNREVTMVSLAGRQVVLRRLSAGTYEVPAALPKGLYFIRIGTGPVLRALF